MEKVFVLTRKHCVPDDNLTEVTIVGLYDSKCQAELQSAEEREKILSEVNKNFDEEDIEVSYIGDLTIVDCGDNTHVFYLDIKEIEINKTVNLFV